MFGFRLPQNFNAPYKATDIADLWRRWHISLSSFFRDYVYFSLGGSRVSRLLTARNLMITMMLVGLWPGANWLYVVFGAYQGLMLSLHWRVRGRGETMPQTTRRKWSISVWLI